MKPRSRRLSGLTFGLVLACAVLLFLLLVAPGLFILPFKLATGWEPAAQRLFEAWHPRPGALELFSLAAACLVLGCHGFARWLSASLGGGPTGQVQFRWRWKWTLCGLGMVGCALLAIVAMVLTVHQTYWLSKSTQPMWVWSMQEQIRLSALAADLEREAERHQWNSAATRTAFGQMHVLNTPQLPLELVQPVWIEQPNHQLRAIVLVPRQPLRRANSRLMVLEPGSHFTRRDLDELPRLLASFGLDAPMTTTPPAP